MAMGNSFRKYSHGSSIVNRHGAAYILALVTLMVGSILSLALMWAAESQFTSECSREKKNSAADLAEAGIDYTCWQINCKSQSLPYSADVKLANGSFHVDAVDDGSREAGSVLITSTGTHGSFSHTIKRVVGNGLLKMTFLYVWCENGDISSSKKISCSGGSTGLRSNGKINLSSHSAMVTNGAWAVGSISTGGSISPQYPNATSISFPDIDVDYYKSIATETLPDKSKISSLSYPAKTGVIFVDGKLTINGTYDGVYTVIATGDVTINDDLKAANSDSHLAIMSDESISVPDKDSVQAVLYSHNAKGEGKVSLANKTIITGSIAADSTDVSGQLDLYADNTLDIDVIKKLQMPGYY